MSCTAFFGLLSHLFTALVGVDSVGHPTAVAREIESYKLISTSKSTHIVRTLKGLTALWAGPDCHADSLWRAREDLEEMEGRLGSASGELP